MQPVLSASTPDELAQGLDLLSRSDFVVLDTEFMRESTYYPVLCLIQAATSESCVVIDPLAAPLSEGAKLQPLWEFLADRKRLKVLHAARQDLEVISQAMQSLDAPPATIPGPIFDTQIAAGLLGHAAQVGYGGLVTQRLGLTLEKGHARTDWSKRPLSVEQLAYAADDVRYLAPLYLNVRDALEAKGRLEWLREEGRELEDPRLYRTEPQDAWRRLKGLDRLQPPQRAVAKLLANWRESRAMQSDKPRGWILSDDTLREIAERLPTSVAALEKVRSLPAGVIRKRGDELAALVAQGKENSGDEPPSFVPSRPEPEVLGRITQLLAFVRAEAERLSIAPELLATRRDVEQLVFSGRAEHLLSGWRREVLGERLVAMAQEPTARLI
jgi:ribonuclease D